MGRLGAVCVGVLWLRCVGRVDLGEVMPNQPRKDNPARAIRIPDELWERAKIRADERGETVSEAVRKFLERYVR